MKKGKFTLFRKPEIYESKKIQDENLNLLFNFPVVSNLNIWHNIIGYQPAVISKFRKWKVIHPESPSIFFCKILLSIYINT